MSPTERFARAAEKCEGETVRSHSPRPKSSLATIDIADSGWMERMLTASRTPPSLDAGLASCPARSAPSAQPGRWPARDLGYPGREVSRSPVLPPVARAAAKARRRLVGVLQYFRDRSVFGCVGWEQIVRSVKYGARSIFAQAALLRVLHEFSMSSHEFSRVLHESSLAWDVKLERLRRTVSSEDPPGPLECITPCWRSSHVTETAIVYFPSDPFAAASLNMGSSALRLGLLNLWAGKNISPQASSKHAMINRWVRFHVPPLRIEPVVWLLRIHRKRDPQRQFALHLHTVQTGFYRLSLLRTFGSENSGEVPRLPVVRLDHPSNTPRYICASLFQNPYHFPS
ncbi:hypothetical protein JHW43_005441 [Diplocarpon mali]|nr:hypothetical protein JHW43_005441 [Diplocarpon mali]